MRRINVDEEWNNVLKVRQGRQYDWLCGYVKCEIWLWNMSCEIWFLVCEKGEMWGVKSNMWGMKCELESQYWKCKQWKVKNGECRVCKSIKSLKCEIISFVNKLLNSLFWTLLTDLIPFTELQINTSSLSIKLK